jgi:carbamate kinase
LTAIDCVYLNFGEENQKALSLVTMLEVKGYLEESHFKTGSMKPKIQGVLKFLENRKKSYYHISRESPESIQGGLRNNNNKMRKP